MTPRAPGAALLLLALLVAGCTGAMDEAATGGEAPAGTRDAATDPAALAIGFPLRLQEVAVAAPGADLGQPVTARAVVKNVGAQPASAKVEFLLGQQVHASALVTLDPGASTLAAGTVRPGRTGTLEVLARIVESGETKTTTLLVHGPELRDANVTVLDVQRCDRVAHRVSFRNAGDGTAHGVLVEAQLRDTDGAVVDRLEQAAGDLKPGEATLLEFSHTAPARCPVRHTYTVHLVVTAQSGVRLEHDTAPFTV